jgi:hypothetical protein
MEDYLVAADTILYNETSIPELFFRFLAFLF